MSNIFKLCSFIAPPEPSWNFLPFSIQFFVYTCLSGSGQRYTGFLLRWIGMEVYVSCHTKRKDYLLAQWVSYTARVSRSKWIVQQNSMFSSYSLNENSLFKLDCMSLTQLLRANIDLISSTLCSMHQHQIYICEWKRVCVEVGCGLNDCNWLSDAQRSIRGGGTNQGKMGRLQLL